AGLGFALAPAVGVIDRVHTHAAHGRADAAPAGAARFAGDDIHMIGVADLADGGVAADVDLADFAGRQLHQGVVPFAVAEDGGLTGGTGDFTTAAGDQLDVVDVRAERDGGQGQRVADFGRGFFP